MKFTNAFQLQIINKKGWMTQPYFSLGITEAGLSSVGLTTGLGGGGGIGSNSSG